jgi:hypothetical protein
VSLQNLAHFALERNDTENAERLAARGQRLFEQAQPDSSALANAYHFHGLVLERRGDFAGAEAEYQRALALMRKLAPDNVLRQAFPIHDLGGVAEKRGERERARQYYEESLAMRSKAAPGGLDEAESLSSLGALELATGKAEAARPRLERASASYAQLAPESRQHALALHRLGLALQRSGRDIEAVQVLCEAARVLDVQRRQVSVSRETQAEFSARYAEIPHACAEARIVAGELEQAFAVIEQSRARALRERLGARDEVLAGAALPAELRTARAGLAQRRAKLEGELAALYKGTDAENRTAALKRLGELQSAEEAWFKSLAQAAPRYAHVLQGDALDARAALARLPADAVALVYVVGTNRSFVLSLSGKDRRIRAAALREGRGALEAAVKGVRSRIIGREDRATLDPGAGAPLPDAGRARRGPARGRAPPASGRRRRHPAAAVRRADRREGSLPRGALGRFDLAIGDRGARTAFLRRDIDRSRLRRRRGARGPALARRFGARIACASGHRSRGASGRDGLRRQVVGARGWRGAGGRRSRRCARSLGAAPRRARLFRHGQSARFRPAAGGRAGARRRYRRHRRRRRRARLGSDGELAPVGHAPGRALGMRHRARARARRRGLVGLTRAFEYAGARSVIATLWPITDRTTAPLMAKLHGAFAGGASPASSLHEAQLELIRGEVRASASATRGVGGLSARPIASAAPSATGGLTPSPGAAADDAATRTTGPASRCSAPSNDAGASRQFAYHSLTPPCELHAPCLSVASV